MYLKIGLFIACLFSVVVLGAQADSIGQWQTLQSFSSGSYVTESENEIIYTTGRAVFYLDKEDLSITRLSRTEGLAEARVNLVKYHPPTSTLIIVYDNSTIDLLRNGVFSTLRQIDNFNFSGDKRIYDVSFGENNTILLAAGYGLSALSLDDETFLFTTFTGVRVNGVAEFDNQLFAATEEGLYRVNRTGVNLNDFGNWDLLGTESGLPGDYSSTAITTWKDRLYFGVEEDVFRLEADTAALHYDADPADYRLQYLSPGPSRLLAGYRCQGSNCADRQLLVLSEVPGEARRKTNCLFRTNYALEDDRGRIWFGDDAQRIRYFPNLDSNCEELTYPGPPRDENFRLLHDGNALWVAPGVLDENFSPSFDFEGVYRFAEGQWTTLDRDNTTAFLGRDGQRDGDDDVATIVDVHYDDVNDIHYFSSFYEGLIALDANGEATLFDETNSSLQLSPAAGPGRVRVAGAATDAQGFTYFANSRAGEGGIVSVRSPDGNWAALGQGCSLNVALDIAVDGQGLVWVIHAGSIGGGITVLDPMGTPLDPSDDRCIELNSSNTVLPTNQVRSIAVDLDDVVWIGTAEGIVTFNCFLPLSAGDCNGFRPVAVAGGFGGFLLETEEVRAITVDGGNRKWVATSGGVYLLSEDGGEQLAFFDSGNSPLLDNLVRDIAIDPNTGTVYFGTELGIISYRSEATAARSVFREDLVVFPNPVEPGYDGPVAISGLTRNARVKITDLSGKLVNQGFAAGGQYIWSGTDYNGRRVTSGVYLVFASNNGNEDEFFERPGGEVGKIVFIR